MFSSLWSTETLLKVIDMQTFNITEIMIRNPRRYPFNYLRENYIRDNISETAGIYAISLVNWADREIEPAAEIDQLEDFNQLFEKKSIFLNGLPTDILYIGRSTNLRRRIIPKQQNNNLLTNPHQLVFR